MNISESVQVLLESNNRVVEEFYERLLTDYPELGPHFRKRNSRLQASIITMAIASVEAYYTHRFPATEHYLKVLGHRHYHEGIRAEDFSKFRDVLIWTLTDFLGGDWDQTLEGEWREALELAIQTVREGYRRAYTM